MRTGDKRPRIRRGLVVAATGAVIAGAGVGGYLAITGGGSSVHLTAATVNAAPQVEGTDTGKAAPDTDNVQQQDQSGVQDTTGADTAAAGAEATTPEADGPGGHADAAGAADQTGDFNN